VPEPTYVDQGARFDDVRVYRYRLWRAWSWSAPRVAFLMLNPSTADETQLDPTLRRCLGFAHAWGYGGFEVINLFALRSPKPDVLYGHRDPVGAGNDAAILDVTLRCALTVAAWGTHGAHLHRGDTVKRMVANAGRPALHVLRLSKDGHPVHPLYLPAGLKPTPWR
jgi:hypothetical protein